MSFLTIWLNNLSLVILEMKEILGNLKISTTSVARDVKELA